MTEIPIKRDGRKENANATQAALQSAALRWFSEQGFEKAPVGKPIFAPKKQNRSG